MTVAELLARVSSAELTEWIAFYAIEADDEHRRNAPPVDPRAKRAP